MMCSFLRQLRLRTLKPGKEWKKLRSVKRELRGITAGRWAGHMARLSQGKIPPLEDNTRKRKKWSTLDAKLDEKGPALKHARWSLL